eukprot:3688509-Rhodomonas_salina.1
MEQYCPSTPFSRHPPLRSPRISLSLSLSPLPFLLLVALLLLFRVLSLSLHSLSLVAAIPSSLSGERPPCISALPHLGALLLALP